MEPELFSSPRPPPWNPGGHSCLWHGQGLLALRSPRTETVKHLLISGAEDQQPLHLTRTLYTHLPVVLKALFPTHIPPYPSWFSFAYKNAAFELLLTQASLGIFVGALGLEIVKHCSVKCTTKP